MVPRSDRQRREVGSDKLLGRTTLFQFDRFLTSSPMAAFSKLTSEPDKRSWATLEQIRWLVAWLQEYIEAQQTHRLHVFWPELFLAWFAEYPLLKPSVNDVEVAEPEPEDDSDVPAELADEVAVKAEKRKHKQKETKRKARAKKVCLNYSLSYYRVCSLYPGCLRQDAYARAENNRTMDFEKTRGK